MAQAIKEPTSLNKPSLNLPEKKPGRLTPKPEEVPKEKSKNGYPKTSTTRPVEETRAWELQEDNQVKETEKRDRASTGFQIFLYTLAGLFDLVPIILNFFIVGVGVNRIITVVGWGVFFIIMKIKKIDPITHSSLYWSLAAMSGLEFIPVVDFLPFWVRVAYTIISTLEAEDGTTHGISRAMGAVQGTAQKFNQVKGGISKVPKVPSAVK